MMGNSMEKRQDNEKKAINYLGVKKEEQEEWNQDHQEKYL